MRRDWRRVEADNLSRSDMFDCDVFDCAGDCDSDCGCDCDACSLAQVSLCTLQQATEQLQHNNVNLNNCIIFYYRNAHFGHL